MGSRVPSSKNKRKLRQEVNFGCAVCGCPLIEYHQIIPYAEKEQSNPEDMIALCPNHHQPADDGVITRTELFDYKENPSNSDEVDYLFHFNTDCPVIPFGEIPVEFASSGKYVIVQVGGENIISINYTDGRIEFDVDLYNNSNELVATITDNEWWANTREFWDIKYQSKRLKIWNAKYEIGFLAEYEPEDSQLTMRGRFLYDGLEVIIHPSKTILGNDVNIEIRDIGVVLGYTDGYESRIEKPTVRIRPPLNGLFNLGDNDENFVFDANPENLDG